MNQINKEIEGFDNRLTEFLSPTNKKKIEHFQNQFFIQKNVIAELKNEIKKHDFAIERNSKQPFDPLKARGLDYHEKLTDKIETELKLSKI